MDRVAYLKVDDLYSDDNTKIPIHSNDSFYLGRHASSCRFSWDHSCISSQHLRIHCVMFDDGMADPIPLVYVEDNSRNGTILTTNHGLGESTEASTVFLHGSKSGAVLLNHGDELLLSGVLKLIFLETRPCTRETLQPEQLAEHKLLQDRYLITNRKLGVGGQGSVYVALEKATFRQLACKTIRLKQPLDSWVQSQLDRETGKKSRKVFREFSILKDISHPNIVTIEKVFWSSNTIYIFQELITGGDLFSYIEFKGGSIPDAEAAFIVLQILKAVEYLHDLGIVHRDLKPDNMLVTSLDDGARIVLTDFGSARYLPRIRNQDDTITTAKRRMFTVAGTTEFAAPEIHSKNPLIPCHLGYTESADMWSVGCITAALLSGDVVFIDRTHLSYHEDPRRHIIKLASRCNLDVLDESSTWSTVGRRPKDLIRNLLTLDENSRLTAKKALAHPWFTNSCYEAELRAMYERAVQTWQPRRKAFRIVERLEMKSNQLKGVRNLPKYSPYFSKSASRQVQLKTLANEQSLSTADQQEHRQRSYLSSSVSGDLQYDEMDPSDAYRSKSTLANPSCRRTCSSEYRHRPVTSATPVGQGEEVIPETPESRLQKRQRVSS